MTAPRVGMPSSKHASKGLQRNASQRDWAVDVDRSEQQRAKTSSGGWLTPSSCPLCILLCLLLLGHAVVLYRFLACVHSRNHSFAADWSRSRYARADTPLTGWSHTFPVEWHVGQAAHDRHADEDLEVFAARDELQQRVQHGGPQRSWLSRCPR